MENLDSLSNEEVRLRLLEYGAQNLPVTLTTRKVLIKKLRNFIDGEATKVRRETIHVTKFSSDEDSDSDLKKKKSELSNNRRATMQPPVTKSSRKSGRFTPTNSISSGKYELQPTVVIPTVFELLEDSEEDVPQIAKEKQRSRKSKSPSLGKSEIVVTSFQQVLEKTEEEPAVEINNFEPVEETIKRKIPESIAAKRATLFSYSTSNKNYESSPQKTSHSRYSTQTESTNRQSFNPSSYQYHEELNKEYKAKPSFTATPSADTYTKDIKDLQAPYLSEFTRRLQRLKAEPLAMEPNRTQVQQRMASTNYKKVQKAKTNTIFDTFCDFFNELDRAYNIKKIVYISLILLIIFLIISFYF